MAYRNAEARLPNVFLPLADADAKARRAFWRGLFIGVVLTGVFGAIAGVLT